MIGVRSFFIGIRVLNFEWLGLRNLMHNSMSPNKHCQLPRYQHGLVGQIELKLTKLRTFLAIRHRYGGTQMHNEQDLLTVETGLRLAK